MISFYSGIYIPGSDSRPRFLPSFLLLEWQFLFASRDSTATRFAPRNPPDLKSRMSRRNVKRPASNLARAHGDSACTPRRKLSERNRVSAWLILVFSRFGTSNVPDICGPRFIESSFALVSKSSSPLRTNTWQAKLINPRLIGVLPGNSAEVGNDIIAAYVHSLIYYSFFSLLRIFCISLSNGIVRSSILKSIWHRVFFAKFLIAIFKSRLALRFDQLENSELLERPLVITYYVNHSVSAIRSVQ